MNRHALTKAEAARVGVLEPIATLTAEPLDELLSQIRIARLPADESVRGGAAPDLTYLVAGTVALGPAPPHTLLCADDADAKHPLPLCEGIRTVSAATLVIVDGNLLDRLLIWSQISVPDEAVVMAEDRIITVDKGQWLRTMLRSSTFRRLPAASLEELLHRMEPIAVTAGQIIIRQGDPGDYFYMIDEGIALVSRNPDDDEDRIELAELAAGATFGEAALLSDSPRNATVAMMSDGILLRLSRADFNKLLRQPTLQWISLEEARRKVGSGGASWLDVRLPGEYARGHLVGARNTPVPVLHRIARTLDPRRHYVCYCQTGQRSSAAAFILNQYGLQASVLKAGLGPLTPAQRRT